MDTNDDTGDGCECQVTGEEICDGIDNNCNGLSDDNVADAPIFLVDSDNDGYGKANTGITACEAPEGYVVPFDEDGDGTPEYDCDDNNLNPDLSYQLPDEVWQQWITSWYWALTMLMKMPNVGPDTTLEKLYSCVIVILGAIFFALLLGQVNAITRADTHAPHAA